MREGKERGVGKAGVLQPGSAYHGKSGSAMYLCLISGKKTRGAQSESRKMKEGTRSAIQGVVRH